MSASKDGKADSAAPGPKATARTVVGVPALPEVPPDRPSDLEMTRQLAPTHEKEAAPARAPDEEEASTAIDVKAISQAEAERVLRGTGFTQEEIPTVHAASSVPPAGPVAASPVAPSPKAPGVVGALPRPAPRPLGGTSSKTLPPSADMFLGLRPASVRPPMGPEKPTRPGVASPAPVTAKGRATLLLDGSAPPVTELAEGEPSQERPPIVVPGASATAPKAVTQAPPWNDGEAQVGPSIPKGPPPPRATEPSMEEISSSLLLAADASSEVAPALVEELSGSLLVEDAPDAKGRPVVRKPPVPSTPPPAPPRTSVKPPVPRSPSARPPEPAHRALLGMPELPTATPPPHVDTMVASPPSAPPVETVVVSEPFAPPPVPEPVQPLPTAPMTGDIELTRLPRGGLQPLFDSFGEAMRKLRQQLASDAVQGRPRWFFPAVIVGGLSVGIGLFAILGSVIRHGGDSARGHDPQASGGASAQPSAMPVPPIASVAPSPTASGRPPVPALPACVVSGTPHVIAPGATVTAGVEVVRLGDDLALGFAPSDHDAIGVRLDPASLSAKATVKARSRDVVRRATPLLNARGALVLAVDTDRKKDPLQGRRTVLADPPIQLGASDAHVSWARPQGGPAGELWPLEDGANVEAMRGAAENTSERTVALSFRHGAAVWMGVATGTSALAPKGPLARMDGLGTAVGSPAIALSGGSVMVAWSDRAASDDPWRLRWTHFDVGNTPSTPETFTPPAGGKGEQAMSPSLTALPGGRFLFVWTEGPASGHDVRALTLGPDGKPVGDALAISNPGVNAGQGQAAVTPLGQGVVAFLETGGNGFQVVATPIVCGE